MVGEHNLTELLRSMNPQLAPDEYVFSSVTPQQRERVRASVLMEFSEQEGITLILRRGDAEHEGLSFAFACRLITLNVHSSLEAIGFLAVITRHLAAAQISVNVVSAYYHDHLLIPVDKADEAMQILKEMTVDTPHQEVGGNL